MSKVFTNGEMAIELRILDNITLLNTEHVTQFEGRVLRNNLTYRANHWTEQPCGW